MSKQPGAKAQGLPAKPGATIRELRARSGLTLTELSERSGLPISTLSKLENDKMSLTYDKLARISEGLGVDMAQIFAGPTPADTEGSIKGRRSITRASEGGVIDTPTYHHVYHAVDMLNKKFIPLVGEIKTRSIAEFGELIHHEGEEYTYVMEGALEFHSAYYAPVVLEAGDSIYFDSSMGHAYIAIGKAPCRVLSICAGHLQAIDYDARRQDLAAAVPSVPPKGLNVTRGKPRKEKPAREGTKSRRKRTAG